MYTVLGYYLLIFIESLLVPFSGSASPKFNCYQTTTLTYSIFMHAASDSSKELTTKNTSSEFDLNFAELIRYINNYLENYVNSRYIHT